MTASAKNLRRALLHSLNLWKGASAVQNLRACKRVGFARFVSRGRSSGHALTLSLLVGLAAGCGGGHEMPATSAQVVKRALAAKETQNAMAAESDVTAEQAAVQLMDFAEWTYPSYFPRHALNQSFGPFMYRAYDTGALLGVAVRTDSSYVLGGVYVMGATFGEAPVYVGLVDKFIKAIDPTPGLSGGNGCYDLKAMNTEGTSSVVTYRTTYGNVPAGTQTFERKVGRIVPFNGQQVRVATTLRKGRLSYGGFTDQVHTQLRSTFYRRIGAAATAWYGDTWVDEGEASGAASGPKPFTFSYRVVPTTPWIDARYGLAIGGTDASSSQYDGVAFDELGMLIFSAREDATRKSTYVGRETITVPAGVFQTCRYEFASSFYNETGTHWIIAGEGVMVKSVAAILVTEATAVTLNGVPQ